eukprot:CAMPEP_0113647026 /NCGR_PEP_ID=MMETSP0017_2-20120614/24870_1 /TAXON_ID=2856 /ORGANISM="Cylindrotheca closterium" /LENGTH=129 /DNA_ID=CAMNT_0000559013 /DNA_START=62 /DNA_END=451 /DNA_ORIENTATION=- /assembly_acc=CAM_ASM_000147
MMVRPAEEESEAEVRREDQDNINKFARLNARLHDVRDERALIKKSLERLDDAATELMMASGDPVLLLIGESFFDTTEEDATEFCEEEVERMQGQLESLEKEEGEILEKQTGLKKALYARFGKSIQLEDK